MTDSQLPKPTAPKLPQPSSQNMIDDHSTVSSGSLPTSSTGALPTPDSPSIGTGTGNVFAGVTPPSSPATSQTNTNQPSTPSISPASVLGGPKVTDNPLSQSISAAEKPTTLPNNSAGDVVKPTVPSSVSQASIPGAAPISNNLVKDSMGSNVSSSSSIGSSSQAPIVKTQTPPISPTGLNQPISSIPSTPPSSTASTIGSPTPAIPNAKAPVSAPPSPGVVTPPVNKPSSPVTSNVPASKPFSAVPHTPPSNSPVGGVVTPPVTLPANPQAPVQSKMNPVSLVGSNPTPLNNAPKPLPSSPTAAPMASVQPVSPIGTAGNPQPKPLGNVQPVVGGNLPPKSPVVAPVVAATPASPPPTGPKTAEPKKPILRFLPFILLGVILLAIVGGIAAFFLNRNAATTDVPTDKTPVANKKTIEYWGLWESTGVMDEVLAEFEQENNVDIKYTQQSHKEYRERVQTAIASGKGPDVFRFHASWVPMMKTELSPLPEKIMSPTDFAAAFYPIATTQLTLNGKLIGIPLMYEGLGLYYNTDVFSVANKTVPQDWEELKNTAVDLTIKSGTQITRGGIALGTTENVEHFSDIIGLMMLQNGADPADPTSEAGQDALAFYTSFAKTLQVWDQTLPSATVAFARGDVAMMIAPSWRVHEIKSQNPQLNFAIAPVPQLPSSERVAWASYWAEGVSAQSKNKEISWKLIEYLSSEEVQKKMYSEAKKERAFGPLYSRINLASEVLTDPYVGAYFQDAPYAKNWYLNGYTHDNGLNDRSIKYYQDAVNAGNLTETTLNTIKQGIAQVLQQYGLVTAAPPVAQ